VEGWGKIVAGVVIGVAGTVYATNEELRKRLPKTARDLPDSVRQRFESAVSAAREASSQRREEILRDLERHDAAHAARPSVPGEPEPAPVEQVPTTDGHHEATENTEGGSR
jgi:hypothetical protein